MLHCCRQELYFRWQLSNFEEAASYSFCLIAIESREPRKFWRKWKKVNYMWWSSINFCGKKQLIKPRISLINNLGTLEHQFNAIQVRVTSKAMNAQLRFLHGKLFKRSTIWCWQTGVWKIARSLRPLDTSYSSVDSILNYFPQAQSYDNFGVFQPQSGQVIASFHNRGRNFGSPQDTTCQGINL